MSRRSYAYESSTLLSRRAFGPLLCVMLLFYLGFHTISGERGLLAMFEEKNKHEELVAELEKAKAKRASLETKVTMLSDDSLDLDLLDEQARRMLGLVGKGELVIFLDQN